MELSRRRSIKLKAQVDKLQESKEGLGWSQHRERVKVTLNTRTQCIPGHDSALDDYDLFLFISIPGHTGGSVCSAAAAPADGVRPASSLSWGKPTGRGSDPAAECGSQSGNEPHQTGTGNTHTQTKLLIIFL